MPFKTATGSTIKNVPLKAMRAFNVPLAPLPIQRSIVSKIETLFSDLDNDITDLKKAQKQLKIYRQAVLKKAFEGNLSKNSNKKDLPNNSDLLMVAEPIAEYKKQSNPGSQKNHGTDKLPIGWKWVKLGEVADMCLG